MLALLGLTGCREYDSGENLLVGLFKLLSGPETGTETDASSPKAEEAAEAATTETEEAVGSVEAVKGAKDDKVKDGVESWYDSGQRL